MEIHVVRPGESIWVIAGMYRVSADSIIEVNKLNEIPYLVPGQALVIPVDYTLYTVRQGDTIWQISKKYGVSVNSITELNKIVNPDLIYPGMVIRIPDKPGEMGDIEVNGYVQPLGDEADTRIIEENGRYLTYVSVFSYRADEDGRPVPADDSQVLEAINGLDVAPLLVITNFRGGNFDPALAHAILTDTGIQNTLINNVIMIMKNKGYYGLNIDFEHIPPEDRELYSSFVRRAVSELRAEGFQVSVALAPKPYDIKTGSWYGAHDYRALGEAADFVVLMTYEWGWSGGPPMAVAPIDKVAEVVDYAVSVIPPEKIMMGVPLYGYDWTLPYVPGGIWARQVSPLGAVELAVRYGAVINYDETAQSPFFNYVAENGSRHVVWFEDARSVRAKFMLTERRGLRGVSYWVLGNPFPQNWYILDYMFQITKVVSS